MSTPEQHNFGQRDLVRSGLYLADDRKDRHNVTPIRPYSLKRCPRCSFPGGLVRCARCHGAQAA